MSTSQHSDRRNPKRISRARLWAPAAALLALSASSLTGCDLLSDYIDSISDGAECTSSGSCLGDWCLLESEGFPGGYCTTLDCEIEGCSNMFGSECLDIHSWGPACYETCDADRPCRDGYLCLTVDTARVCLPADQESRFPMEGEIGTACSNGTDCNSGSCLTNFVGGYCTVMDCSDDSVCDGGRCLELGEGSSTNVCFRGCENDDQCRFGYACVDPDGSGGVCQESDETNPVRNPTGLDDGEPCTVDINCKGGTCLREEGEGYPGGYCTTLDCGQVGCNTPSGERTECIANESTTACFIGCASETDCRDGYECRNADSGEGYCVPPRTTQPLTPTGSDEIICSTDPMGNGRRLSFDISSSAIAFTVVPFSPADQMVRPTELRLPDGSVGADFDGDYSFLGVNPDILVSLAPVFFPAAPQFDDIVAQGGGTYTLDVTTDDANMCFYVLEKTQPGSNIDLNFYLVGVPGMNASSAATNSDFSRMLDTFEDVYTSAGINLRTVRYFDVTGTDLDRYRVIRNINDLWSLVSISEDPGPTLEERLSVNVFFIEGFAIPQAPGLLGMSLGIPGVPGFHGNAGAGLIFTSEYLPDDPEMVGQTMAHEVGHFNGLRHTTEHGGTEADPLSDTPRCSNPDQGALCPDAGNLMFPFSLDGVDQTTVSDEQAFVLQRSPLIQ